MLKEKAPLTFPVNFQPFEEKSKGKKVQRKQKQSKKAVVLKPEDEMI